MENKKRTISIIGIFTFILAIIGGTLAYWTWTTNEGQQTNVVFTVTSDFSCAADGGGNITNNDVSLAPTTCTDTSRAIKRKVTVTPTINRNDLTISMDLWLDIKNIGSGLSASENFRYVLTTSSTSCEEGTIIAEGTFNEKYQDDTVSLLSKKLYTNTSIVPEEYWLYIWLDWPESSDSTMDQPFSLSLNGSCTDSLQNKYTEAILNGADPVLDTNGMIPVTISADGVVTTADTSNEWYSYEDKEWANAILITNASRDIYLNKPNVTVNQDHILAYYVWIPRYKYTFPKADGNPETISIIFESKGTPKSRGTAIGTSYYTHPAFTFGNDELSGIWVGKFETTGDQNTPTILPNEQSMSDATIVSGNSIDPGTGFSISQKFSASENIYGLSNTTTDAHMMKNIEWGAAVYLSHSIYGINKEIYVNNSDDQYTGRSGGAVSSSWTSYGTYSWLGQRIGEDNSIGSYASDRTLGTNASTTGNVTGVYDMSGCNCEFVMGNYGGEVGYSSFSKLPDNKYYDLYTTTDKLTACNGGICYGHALSETANWYGDSVYLADEYEPWLVRDSVFGSYRDVGAASYVCSIRSTLVVNGD